MYCQTCGNEIQIVPDFEPEVEQTIDQAMNHILNDVFQQETEASDQEEISLMQKASLSKRHYFRWIVLLLGISVMVLLLVFGYMKFTPDYQIRRGNYFLKSQDYEAAVKHYKRADNLAPENAKIDLYLAECYKAMDKIAGYEASLTEVIRNTDADQEERKLAYQRLANLYLEKEEYQKINSLLKNCTDEDILDMFGKYCAKAPVFSHKSGDYGEIIPLKIQGSEKGKVYYTKDGKDPTVESKEYTGPVFLEKGEHTIKAICVNEFGVISDVASVILTIRF